MKKRPPSFNELSLAQKLEQVRKYSFRAVISQISDMPKIIAGTIAEQAAVLARPNGVTGETIRYGGDGRYMVESSRQEVPVWIHYWVGQKDFSVLVMNPNGVDPLTVRVEIESILEVDEHYYQVAFKDHRRQPLMIYGPLSAWLYRIK